MSTLKKPNLFIVGFPKTGSTALASFLSQHKDIYTSDQKGLDFFSTDFHRESDKFHKSRKYFPIRSEKTYLNIFKNRTEKYLIDGSVDYIFSKEAPLKISKFNSDSKIIILIREPTSFIESYFRHHSTNKGSEIIQDFNKAFNLEKSRKIGKYIPSSVKCPSFLFYSEKITYKKYIKRYVKHFNNSNIKIILYDDWRKDNRKILKEVFKFLNVKDESESISLSEVNIIHSVKFEKTYSIIRGILNSNIKKIIPYNIRKKTQVKERLFNLFKEKKKKEYTCLNTFKQLLGKSISKEITELNNYLHDEKLLSKDINLNELWKNN